MRGGRTGTGIGGILLPAAGLRLMRAAAVGSLGLLSFVGAGAAGAAEEKRPAAELILVWDTLPPLPDPHGVAGPFAGVAGGALLVAGGANFPEGKPWEGGVKKWHDAVYALPDGATTWTLAGRLPRPLAYGVSVTLPEGVLCIGGDDAGRAYADVLLLKWENSRLSIVEMPALPVPTSGAAGALLNDRVYVMGGTGRPGAVEASRNFWELDLSNAGAGWKSLEPWPGPGRMLPVAATLSDSLYLASGVSLAAGPDGKPVRTYLRDAYRFTPGQGWKRVADLPRAAVAAPSPAPAFGTSDFLILGGDDGALAGRPAFAEHPGFPRTALWYRTAVDAWTEMPGLAQSRVTAPAVEWKNRTVLPSGEVRPGVRTPEVAFLKLPSSEADPGGLDPVPGALNSETTIPKARKDSPQ